MGYYVIKEPKYFREFVCKGAACESNCCRGWENLIWLDGEYEKLLSLSDEIRDNAKREFTRLAVEGSDEPLWNLGLSGRSCPFLADGLCRIQRDFGEDCISNTCRIYPRVSVFNSAVMTRGCYSSCPEVAKMLLNDEAALEMCVRQVQVNGGEILLSAVLCEGEEDFQRYPALRYRNELFGLFYDILSDKKRAIDDIDDKLLFAAEIAWRLSEVEAEEIPGLIEQVRRSEITPEIEFEGGIYSDSASELFAEFFGSDEAISSVLTDGKPDLEKIEKGAGLFPGFFFGNLALNYLFELKMPFYHPQKSLFENLSLFVSVYSMAKLLLSASALDGGTELALRRLSEFNRVIVHGKTVDIK